MTWRLVPDDAAFALMFRRAENLLQGLSRVEQSAAAEAGPELLPTALTGGEALGALQRAGEVVRDALDAFSVPPADPGQSTRLRVFAEGRERMPLRVSASTIVATASRSRCAFGSSAVGWRVAG